MNKKRNIKFKKVNAAVVALAILASVGASVGATAAPRCADLFKAEPMDLAVTRAMQGHAGRVNYARKLLNGGLIENAYAVEWALKRGTDEGPYARSGEFIATEVNSAKFNAWMEAVGQNSIGLGIDGVGRLDSLGSAGLRIGDKMYQYSDITGNRAPSKMTQNDAFTEATFLVTDAELEAIHKFFKDRRDGRIRAKFDVPRGPKKGDRLEPGWDSGDFHSIRKESCAGACSSFINPQWLEHYEGARILQRLAERLELEDTGVARAMVWRHIRSPEAMALTQFSPTDGFYDKPLENLIKNNRYGTLRGLPVYSLIPDPQSGENSQLRSRRIPLLDWIRR